MPHAKHITSLIPALLLTAIAAADDAAPIARCDLQSVQTADSGDMMDRVPFQRRSLTDSVGDYRRGTGGDWVLPDEIDRDDPQIRLLLLAGKQILLCNLLVYLDGRPFRSVREQWIDEALQPRQLAELQSDSEPKTDTKAKSDRTPRGRLLRYASLGGAELSREEARWLLTQWSPGPPLLELMPASMNQRAELAPVWNLIDRNADGTCSQEEILATSERLQHVDRDEDGWVDLSEIPAATEQIRSTAADSLNMFVLNTDVTNEVMTSQLKSWANQCPGNGRIEGLLDSEDLLKTLQADSADIILEARFGQDDSQGLLLRHVGDQLQIGTDSIRTSDSVITLLLPGIDLEVSAVAGSGDSSNDGQVSVGAAVDGYPILRVLDVNGDRRLSQREVEQATEMMAALDHSQDAVIQSNEIPMPVRLVIAAGPLAHSVLSRPVASAARSRNEQEVTAPDWFVSMDENNDNDLTVFEFLGTDEQFEALDTDQDGRISVAEAAELNDQ